MLCSRRGHVRGLPPPDAADPTATSEALAAAISIEGISHTIQASAFGDFYRQAGLIGFDFHNRLLSLLTVANDHEP